MKKLIYHIGYLIFRLKARLLGKKVVHLGKDYFIYHNGVVEFNGLSTKSVLKYRDTVQYLGGTKFCINNKTILDIDNGIEVLFHNVEIRANSMGFIIDNKQYKHSLELLDEGDVYAVIYRILFTRLKVKRGYIYKALNFNGDVLHQFPKYGGKLKISEEGDFLKCITGKNEKNDTYVMIGQYCKRT